MRPIPLTTEEFDRTPTSGAKDALNLATGSLPPNGAPLTLTLDFNYNVGSSGGQWYAEVKATSGGVDIAAAYNFSGNVKMYDADDVLVQENVLAAHPTLINDPVDYRVLVPIPARTVHKIVYVATYVSGVDPAGVDVTLATVQA